MRTFPNLLLSNNFLLSPQILEYYEGITFGYLKHHNHTWSHVFVVDCALFICLSKVIQKENMVSNPVLKNMRVLDDSN